MKGAPVSDILNRSVNGQKLAEIADQLGITEDAVQKRLTRARDKIEPVVKEVFTEYKHEVGSWSNGAKDIFMDFAALLALALFLVSAWFGLPNLAADIEKQMGADARKYENSRSTANSEYEALQRRAIAAAAAKNTSRYVTR